MTPADHGLRTPPLPTHPHLPNPASTNHPSQFSRLIGTGPRPSASQPTAPPARTPQNRLAAFQRAHASLLRVWADGAAAAAPALDVFVAENLRRGLRRLAELLDDDQRGPTPHACVAFAASARLLATVARVAAACAPPPHDGIAHEALEICRLLIESEEESFLEDAGFARALPGLVAGVRGEGEAGRVGDPATEGTMVEVLFGVASRLRFEPHVLRVWFRPEKPEEDEEELSESERRTRREQFPLFYILLDYVPVEGRAGEFARMGLLYIIETAAASQDLERWIVEGDIAALMASGLGALYSQLSRYASRPYECNATTDSDTGSWL